MPHRASALWAAAFVLLPGCMSVSEFEGKPAPPLRGADATGRPIDLNDYRGRVVLLDFWRTG